MYILFLDNIMTIIIVTSYAVKDDASLLFRVCGGLSQYSVMELRNNTDFIFQCLCTMKTESTQA